MSTLKARWLQPEPSGAGGGPTPPTARTTAIDEATKSAAPGTLSSRARFAADAAWVLALAVAYYAAARYGLALRSGDGLAAPIWPASGIALALVYLRGYRIWPGILIGAFAACAQAAGPTSGYATPLAAALAFTAEPLAGVWVIRRLVRSDTFLDTPRDVFRFAAAVVLVAAFSASVIAALSHSGDAAGLRPDLLAWLAQWLGSGAAMIVLAPLIVAIAKPLTIDWSTGAAFEAILAFCLTYVASLILFDPWFAELLPSPLPFLIFPFLLWIAFRFGQRELSLAVLLVSVVALWATTRGAGPFHAPTPTESLLGVQSFLGVMGAGFFALGASVLENRRSSEAWRNINLTLEQRVRGRTDALAQANEELQRYRDRLEDLVAERTADLELANREIESFSYSVSHDLRSPLRAIDGYSHALLEDYGARLDDKARDYLRRCRAASQRMGLLIDDVLLLSRVTRHELELNQVDLSGLAQEIIAEIRNAGVQREVEFVVQDGLCVQGDEHLLRVVLENLLGNAWKYTAQRSRARVELGAQHHGGEHVFFVADNGIGFDMHYVDKLFGAFQRLHAAEEFEGTGIGLATVQRVMQRHGGRVWAEGQVNKGATFYFAFPERGRTTGPRKAVLLTS